MREVTDQDVSRLHVSRVNVRSALFDSVRLRGVELTDIDVSGELRNVVVNGVDVGELLEAELNRRTPERALMRPDTAEGFRAAWAALLRLWASTLERAAALPPEALHEGVDDEWSFIETLRHLNFATGAWIERMLLGRSAPWHPLDLPWDNAPGWEGIPWDRAARPSLPEVLAVRAARQASVAAVLASLTDDQLATTVSRTEPGWPQLEDFPVKECLLIVVNEEWEHRLYAERDLAIIEARG